MRLRTVAAFVAMLLLSWPLAAQEQRGSIEGVVKDSTGAILPGVAVTVQGASGVKLDTVSDTQGTYRFPSLLPGIYTVSANLQGFGPGTVPEVAVALGQIKKVDFALSLAGVTETVAVTAESPVVDVRQSTRQTNIRSEQVELLPHNRDFTSLVTQAPGANQEAKSGGISIDGASAAENRYIIDGIETTDLVHGQSGKNVLTDFVEEVEVKSSGYPAEYGGSTGGVINVLTKSGTNSLHGNALAYFQGSSLTGDNNPTLRLGLANANKAEYITFPKDENKRWEPGGALGGPIFTDKAWFFGAYPR
jgi:Carboxypeptidase regulatory-like domain/TonB-dependent Receptor Plug Domain